MKVTVSKTDVSVEGDASEIAEAMPSILGAEQPARVAISQQHAAPLELAAPELVEPSPERVREPLHVSEDIELPHERVAAADDWKPQPADPSETPTRRIDRWEDVPVAHRVWNATKLVCHVSRQANEPSVTWCGADVGMFRDPGLTPTGGASVCGNCNRRLEENNRA